jgi:ABC-2 type transport system ATP-binding protein
MSQSLSAPIWNLTVREAVIISGQLKGLKKNQCVETLQYYKEYFELGDLDNQLVGSLSGGFRRIVNFIIAVLGSKPLLILDEPTNDLDPYKRKLLWDQVKKFSSEGTTVLLITHNVVEAENVVDRVAIMFNGKMVITGTPKLLTKHVEDKLKLELVPINSTQFSQVIDEMNSISLDGALIEESSEKLVYVCPKEQLSYIINYIDNSKLIRDYSFSKISLEEVYFKLYTEKNWRGATENVSKNQVECS